MSDIFQLDDNFFCVLPEFDHYDRSSQGGPEPTEYFGPLDLPAGGGDVPWPAGAGDRIFVYYRTSYLLFEPLIQQLAGLGLPTLVVADDASPEIIKQFSTDSLQIITSQVNLPAVAQTCKVAVVAGGLGVSTHLTLGGCPLVMAPAVMEQSQLAYRVAKAGLGIMSIPGKQSRDIGALVRAVLDRPEFADRARAVAQKYQGHDPSRQIAAIADRCEIVASRRKQ